MQQRKLSDKQARDLNSKLIQYSKEIWQKSEMILKALDIDNPEKSDDNKAFELFRYIVSSSKYDNNVMLEKHQDGELEDYEFMCIADIHRCLCENRSSCTSDALALAFLYCRAGLASTHVTIGPKNTDKSFHEVTFLSLGDKAYICDPTLTRTTLEELAIEECSRNFYKVSPQYFFEKMYPNHEVKYIHEMPKFTAYSKLVEEKELGLN